MKKTRTIAIFLACLSILGIGTSIICTGCTNNNTKDKKENDVIINAREDTISDNRESENSEESSDENDSFVEASDTSDLYVSELPTDNDSDDITPQEAATLAMKSYIAYGENNWEDIWDYSDIELYCYLSDGKWYTKDEYLALEEKQAQTNGGGSTGLYLYGETDTFAFETPELMSDDDIENLNNFILSLDDENPPTDFQVEKAYSIKLKYDKDSEIEYTPKIYVFKVNGTWEADIMMSTLEASVAEMITGETD